MSQNYNFKSLQIVNNDKNKENTRNEPNDLTVFVIGETKTIDFIMLDGTRQNFSYSHYLTSWLGKEDENSVIKIFFATHLITIKGYCLNDIYNHLTTFSIKTLKAMDKRYIQDINEQKPFITDILITWKKENEEIK